MLALIKGAGLYIVYGAGLIVFLLSLTGRIKYACFFMAFLLPLTNILVKIHHLPLGNHFVNLLLLGMLTGWLMNKLSRGERIFQKSSYNLILFLYFIFTFLTFWKGTLFLGAMMSPETGNLRLQNWKNYMVLPLLFLLIFNNIETKKNFRVLFIIMCLSIFLSDFYTIRQVSELTAWWNRTKIKGTFSWLGANEVAAFYATYTFVIFGIFLFIKNKLRKWILGALIVLNFYCVLFIFSRGAYLAALGGITLIGIMRKRILLVFVLLILIFWQAVLPDQVLDRIKFTEQQGQLDPSSEKRLNYWQESWEYFKSSPIIGVGFNVVVSLGSMVDTHNIYLRTLAEQGIIGLAFLLAILGLAFKRGLKLYRNASDKFLKGLGLGFCACVISVMIGNLFGDRWTYLPLGAYFWIFLGMVERGNILALKESAESTDKKDKNL